MKVYHLSSCTTCKRILSEVSLPEETLFFDVKSSPINENQLDELYQITQSYEALFNKRAQLYRQKELHKKTLSETDYKELLLSHYTFLKRPVFISGEHIFIGNAKKTVSQLKDFLHDQ